jgi:dTDP-4-dehydrorhamnose 3,5-epimerase
VIFRDTELAGVRLIELERRTDERGFFARAWDPAELESAGLNPALAQVSVAFNDRRRTLRGLHFQAEPHAEAKLVRCTRGAVFDVVVDLRRDSPTFRRWLGIELREDDGRMLYVPEGVAHGYLTLEDATETLYLISEPYAPAAARGVRWNDPAFGIEWPAEPAVISERDRSWPDFSG